MINFVAQNNRRNVILFIHGFTGGKETWQNSSGEYFYDLLHEDQNIQENCDIATFEYFSKLTTILVDTKSTTQKIFALFGATPTKAPKNLGVEEIAELLRTQIKFRLKSYERVFVIAHSMGGLVAKSAIVKDYNENIQNRISLFISLAVPHLGADLANLGKYIVSHPQVKDLSSIGDLIPHLNNQWIKIENHPKIKYFYGTYDNVVPKASAIGTDTIQQDIVSCDDDHTSICKPSSENTITVVATKDFINQSINEVNIADDFEFQSLENEKQFDNEYFVLKLLIADVHQATLKNSKEHFLNAEYARKLFSSSLDQQQLVALYSRIRTLYQNSYEYFLNKDGKIENGGLLVNDVYEKIIREDANFLKSNLPFIAGLHKMGMLHQLANDINQDIWWSEEHSIAALQKLITAKADNEH